MRIEGSCKSWVLYTAIARMQYETLEFWTSLSIPTQDNEGHQRWELADGAKLYDVTHLPCRASAAVEKLDVHDAAAEPGGFLSL